MIRLRKKYRTLFGIPLDQEDISEKQAKDILSKPFGKTGKPHPLGLKLFSHHPDIPVTSDKQSIVYGIEKPKEAKKESKKSQETEKN